jgi:hypothetical protein
VKAFDHSRIALVVGVVVIARKQASLNLMVRVIQATIAQEELSQLHLLQGTELEQVTSVPLEVTVQERVRDLQVVKLVLIIQAQVCPKLAIAWHALKASTATELIVLLQQVTALQGIIAWQGHIRLNRPSPSLATTVKVALGNKKHVLLAPTTHTLLRPLALNAKQASTVVLLVLQHQPDALLAIIAQPEVVRLRLAMQVRSMIILWVKVQLIVKPVQQAGTVTLQVCLSQEPSALQGPIVLLMQPNLVSPPLKTLSNSVNVLSITIVS